MSKKTVLILFIGAALVAGAATAYSLWPAREGDPAPPAPPPVPAEQTPGQTVKYLASEEFGRLDDADKQEYFDSVVDHYESKKTWPVPRAELTDEERERLRKNAGPLFQKMIGKRIDKYFQLPREERTAYLDEMIDRMEEMRKARQERRKQEEEAKPGTPGASTSGHPGPPGRDFKPEWLKRWIEETPPEERAKQAQFMMAIQKRRLERGFKRLWRR